MGMTILPRFALTRLPLVGFSYPTKVVGQEWGQILVPAMGWDGDGFRHFSSAPLYPHLASR